MRILSLRRTLLALVARVLRGWLNTVSAQLEPGSARQPRDSADTRPTRSAAPAPPDHWVELVRQHAPQLLDSDAPDAGDSSFVIDWRADDAPDAPEVEPSVTPRVSSKTSPRARALPLHPPPQPPPASTQSPPLAVATRRSAIRRPLRLEQVAAEALAGQDGGDAVSEHPSDLGAEPPLPEYVRTTTRPVETPLPVYAAQPDGEAGVPAGDGGFRASTVEALTPPSVATSVPPVETTRRGRRFKLPTFSLPTRRRRLALPNAPTAAHRNSEPGWEGSPIREVPTTIDAPDGVTPHFSRQSFERQRIRETQSGIPGEPDVPTIRTGAGGRVAVGQRRTSAGGSIPTRQQRTGVPGAPPQIVMRPTHVQPPLSLADVSADRWASLPDAPDDVPHESSVERRERLKREQEGRAWSE